MFLAKLLTKNFQRVPLLWVEFNLKKYRKYGKEGSCMIVLHPSFKNNQVLKEKLEDICEYIRDTYDMESVV